LRETIGDPPLARLDAGAVGLEVVRAGPFPVGLVELLQIRLGVDVNGNDRGCEREDREAQCVPDRHGSSYTVCDACNAPIRSSARFTSSTPSGGRGACGGSGA